MNTTYNVPIARMRQAEVAWGIDWRGTPEQETLSGRTGTIVNAVPRWVGRPRLILDATEIGHWRRLLWRAQGRANFHRLTMFDPAIVNLANPDTTVPAQADAAAGDEAVRLTVTNSDEVPVFGQILSAGDWPMGVVDVTDLGSDVYEVDVQPPLRAAITTADPVRLVGQGIFQVQSDTSNVMPYGETLSSRLSLSFVEVVGR